MAVALLAAMVAAGCGSSAKKAASSAAPSTSATASTGSGATAAAPTGQPYKIGIPARLSGTGVAAYLGVPNAVSSWEKWVNANGGINGHPVQVELMDSAGDAAKGLAAVKQMVETDKVLMLHLEDPVLDPGLVTYTQQQGVPVVSPFASYPLWNATPNWFALGIQGSDDAYRAGVQIVKDASKTSVGAVVCAEVASCAAADSGLSKSAPPAGIRYDGTFKVSASAPNYTAECLALKAKGTQALYIAISIDVTKKVVADCATQGYQPFFIFPFHVLNPAVSGIPGVSALSMFPTVPWYDQGPATKDFRAALTKYGDITKADEPSMYIWTSLEFFRDAVTKAKLGDNPTRDEVITAMAADKTNLNGLIANVSFTKGQPSPRLQCYFEAGFSGGKFVLPKGEQPICLS
jgi:branched-chain amino acid transport system substrate-binding protein